MITILTLKGNGWMADSEGCNDGHILKEKLLGGMLKAKLAQFDWTEINVRSSLEVSRVSLVRWGPCWSGCRNRASCTWVSFS